MYNIANLRSNSENDALRIEYNGKNLLLWHVPEKAMNLPLEGEWLVHGHHHNNQTQVFPFINGERKTVNVLVELMAYNPLSMDRLFELMDSV